MTVTVDVNVTPDTAEAAAAVVAAQVDATLAAQVDATLAAVVDPVLARAAAQVDATLARWAPMSSLALALETRPCLRCESAGCELARRILRAEGYVGFIEREDLPGGGYREQFAWKPADAEVKP